MADNSKTKERLKEITDSIETGIQELFESDKYRQYLRTMSRFHSYSLNNTILIAMQKPDATLVAGFNKWRDTFSRNVKKGERSIKIIAPTPYKVKKEQEKVDPVTKAPVLDANGKVQTEEVEIKIPMYKVVSVFDVSQTEGKPLPVLAENLTGDVKHYDIFMEALKRSSPVPLFFEELSEDLDGYFNVDKQLIGIRVNMSEIQTVSATIHEIAHSKLHNYEKEQQEKVQSDENAEPIKTKDRRTEEVEAESISFAVCSYYGINTDENSLGYIASWSKGKDLPELRSSLETINKTASALITDIDKHFAEIVKEKGIDLSAKKADLLSDEPIQEHTHTMPDNDINISDRNSYGYTYDEMLPLTKERAAELFEQDLTVYLLYQDNTEAMAFEIEDIYSHDGIFGIETAAWTSSKEFEELQSAERISELEQHFFKSPTDAYAIYQLKDNEELRYRRFEGLESLKTHHLSVERENYNLVYTERFTGFVSVRDRLEELWERFNLDHPDDFKGHSMSVSDIIAIKHNGKVTYHYCDSYDFVELPNFKVPALLVPDNSLRTAELSTEQNFNQIDGILNNQPTAGEKEKRTSVMEQLKTQAVIPKEKQKTAPTGAEMER